MAGLPSSGATTTVDPVQVAREFSQRSRQKTDGLPDKQIQSLLQTRDGYLWIGTRRGLARFDGLRFTVFDHLNTPAMPDDNCKSLAEDTEGNLWIAMDDGLVRHRDGSFKRFTQSEGLARENGLWQDKIGVVYADRRSGLWANTFGLDRLRDGAIRHFSQEQGLVRLATFALHEDSAGVLWAGGPLLHRFNEHTEKFEVEPES